MHRKLLTSMSDLGTKVSHAFHVVIFYVLELLAEDLMLGIIVLVVLLLISVLTQNVIFMVSVSVAITILLAITLLIELGLLLESVWKKLKS